MEQAPISENRRDGGTDGTDILPEGADPLLWELGQLRNEIERWMADLRARIAATQAMQQPQPADLPEPDGMVH